MADPLDPQDVATIEKLAASGLWEQAGLVEALRLKEGLGKQEILDALAALRRENPEVAQTQEHFPESSPVTEIERELIEDILTLFDEQGLTREQTLPLLGQVTVLLDLVKQRQAHRNSQ